MQKIWVVEAVNPITGMRLTLATTMRGDDAKRIARDVKKPEGYTIETRLD